jgi:hypothetical protein
MNSNPTTLSVDEQIDEILKRLCMDYNTNYESLKNDWIIQIQATDHNKAVAKELLKSLIFQVCEEVTPDRCTATRGNKQNPNNPMYSTKYAKGWNECIDEQRTKLNKILEKGEL